MSQTERKSGWRAVLAVYLMIPIFGLTIRSGFLLGEHSKRAELGILAVALAVLLFLAALSLAQYDGRVRGRQ